jgi:hypothetical protein
MKQQRSSSFADAVPLDGRGQRKPADVLCRAIRDHLLRTAADSYCQGMSDRAAAAYLRSRLVRYREGAFRRDRICETLPDRQRGTINELLWSLLMVRDAVPGDRTIRAALGHDFPLPTP